MRLWSYQLIPYLPRTQLLSLWRELNSIYKKQDQHILINYIYLYDKLHLYSYSKLVIDEMKKRGYKIKSLDNFKNYFKDNDYYEHAIVKKPFALHHNYRYLKQCFYNLQEKYDRGQKDFSDELFDAMNKFMLDELITLDDL